MIKNDSPHSDRHTIFYRATFDGGVVANFHIAADGQWISRVYIESAFLLNINTFPDGDGTYVTVNHLVLEHGTVLSYMNPA